MKTIDLSYGGHFMLDNRLIEVWYLSSVLTVETKKVQQLIIIKKTNPKQWPSEEVYSARHGGW